MMENLTKELIYTCEDGMGTLILNRPDKLNAGTTTMYDGICQVADEVHNNDNVKVLLISGAGRAFCAGSDVRSRIAELAGETQGRQPEKSTKQLIRPYGDFCGAIYNIGKPTIAAVNGVAVGVGLSIALACDIRIASEQARFGAVWVNIGLIPDGGATYLLPRTIGLDKALELAYTGEIIDARKAENIGLITKLVPHDDLMEVATELALKIATGPSVAIELMRRGMHRALHPDIDSHLDFETYVANLCFQTEDFKEGTAAFREKRKPRFQGR